MAAKVKPKTSAPADSSLNEVKLEIESRNKERRHTEGPSSLCDVKKLPKVSSRSCDFVYVNSAYAGSLNSVSENRLPEPPTSVIREQYWACSKWPYAQRVLALVVGVLAGAVIGLAVTVALRGVPDSEDNIFDFFRTRPAPD